MPHVCDPGATVTRLRVASDVGGTFTDICVLDEDTGVISVAKVPSTPADPIDAVIDGVRNARPASTCATSSSSRTARPWPRTR